MELKDLLKKQRELSLLLATDNLTPENRRATTETLRDITAAIEAAQKERELNVEEDKVMFGFLGEVVKAAGSIFTAGIGAGAGLILGSRILYAEKKDIIPISKSIPLMLKFFKC